MDLLIEKLKKHPKKGEKEALIVYELISDLCARYAKKKEKEKGKKKAMQYFKAFTEDLKYPIKYQKRYCYKEILDMQCKDDETLIAHGKECIRILKNTVGFDND